MKRAFSFEEFKGIQRLPLMATPTPLIELESLSELLKGPRIFMKREDLSEFGMGGNKVRKFEFFMADALRKDADCCIAIGAIQSNHARVTAASALHCGLKTHLLLMGERPSEIKGNLLLDHLFGAEITFIPKIFDFDGRMDAMIELASRLKKDGNKPYVLPIVNSLGCLGSFIAMIETLTQAKAMGIRFDRQFNAIGSGETLIGLSLAATLEEPDLETIGICIGRKKELMAPGLEQLKLETMELLKISPEKANHHYTLSDNFLGEAGHPSEAAYNAIRLVAKTEGIVLDPIYTGKTMATLLDMIEKKNIDRGETILFWNSSSAPIFFSYDDYIKDNK